MGDATREAPDRLHPLRLYELCLKMLLFLRGAFMLGDVLHHGEHTLLSVEDQLLNGTHAGTDCSVLPPESHFLVKDLTVQSRVQKKVPVERPRP